MTPEIRGDDLFLWLPLDGKSTRRRGHLKWKVIVKWPIHLFPCEEAQSPPQPEKNTRGAKSRDDDDNAEVIFVGSEHVSEDTETLLVRVSSSSKPVISNIFNSVTRDSSSRRKKGHMSPDPSCMLQPAYLRTPATEPVAVSPASQSECGGRESYYFQDFA